MATPILLPKLGNTVESCILVDWKVQIGDHVEEGDVIAEVETDKAIMEIESTAAGTILALNYQVGDDIPVHAAIALVGAPEEATKRRDDEATRRRDDAPNHPVNQSTNTQYPISNTAPPISQSSIFDLQSSTPTPPISPRARRLAERKHVDLSSLTGSGPGGRIIERDVAAALARQPKLSPVAAAKVAAGAYEPPPRGSGPGGRVMARDLMPRQPVGAEEEAPEAEMIPMTGVRRVVAERMLASVQSTAQLTLHSSADATRLRALRARLKTSAPELGLRDVTINHLVLFAVARTLPDHPALNAHLQEDAIRQFRRVHLGVAVDAPRGLMVPVIRDAAQRSLKNLAEEARRLTEACRSGRIAPDELSGGTFTVTNLGAFGVESFTPILNPPQVAILGVGAIRLQPVEEADGSVGFAPHVGLSLTIDHQAVDGAQAARFLQALAHNLAQIDLLLAV